jgi:hypothetical protein
LSHAQDHLQAMSILADAPGTVMTSFSLVRPVLSSTARVTYLLDPAASAQERLRRGMNLQLESYTEQRNLSTGGLNAESERATAHFAERIRQILQGAREHHLRFSQPKQRSDRPPSVPWLGTPQPREMQLVRQVLSELEDVHGVGAMVYRLASASVHGQPHAMSMLTRRMLREDAPEVVLAEFGLPLRTFVLVCSAPVLAVHKAALTATAYAGSRLGLAGPRSADPEGLAGEYPPCH